MFDQLITEAASRFNVSAASVSGVVTGLLSLMTNERTGGPDGFVDLFRRAGVGDTLTSWFGGKEGRPLTTSHVESALGTSALEKLASSSGLARATASALAAFLLPRLIGRLTPNGVLPSSSALLSQVTRYIDAPAASSRSAVLPVEPRMEPRIDRRPERGGWPGWLPWAAAAAALLALVGWLSMRGPAGTIDPQLTLNNRDGKVTYSGVVRDDATRTAIATTLRTAFGDGNVSGDVRIDRNVRRAAWLPRLGDLFAAVKTPGVDLSLNGDAIKLGGWLSAADRRTLADKLRGIFGSGVSIESLGDPALEAARAANDKALSALRAIGTSGVSSDAVVQAMNLAVINFSSGSAEIAQDSLEVIRKSAEAIERAPAGSTVEIRGHTDNTGDPSSNTRLSQARAEAVKNALVSAGVPADRLTARGYGDTQPRASNDTEYGRFQNRRIEYAVVR